MRFKPSAYRLAIMLLGLLGLALFWLPPVRLAATEPAARPGAPTSGSSTATQVSDYPLPGKATDILASSADTLVYTPFGNEESIYVTRMIDGTPHVTAVITRTGVRSSAYILDLPGEPIVLSTPQGLWGTDGTATGTHELIQSWPVAQTSTLLVTYNSDGMYRTSGSLSSTMQIADGTYAPVRQIGDLLYAVNEEFLWSYSLTTGNWEALAELPAPGRVMILTAAPVNGRLLIAYAIDSDASDLASFLISTDGTAAGTDILLADGLATLLHIDPISQRVLLAYDHDSISALNRSSADDPHAVDLISTDGTLSGTQVLSTSINPSIRLLGASDSEILLSLALTGPLQGLAVNRQTLALTPFPLLNSGEVAFTVSQTTGTFIYTYPPEDTNDPPVDSPLLSVSWLDYATHTVQPLLTNVVVNRFSTNDPKSHMAIPETQSVLQNIGGSGSCELWLLNASSAQKIALPGCMDSYQARVTVGERVVFKSTVATGTELWGSDGTLSGTVKLSPIHPGYLLGTTVAPDGRPIVLYTAADAQHGTELWASDGTVSGTGLVADMTPGADSTSFELGWPGEISSVNEPDGLYFGASTPAYGQELWRSNGTAEGTQLIADLNPGPGSGVHTITAPSWPGRPNTLLVTSHTATPATQMQLYAVTLTPDLRLKVTGPQLTTQSVVSLDLKINNYAYPTTDTLALNLTLPPGATLIAAGPLDLPTAAMQAGPTQSWRLAVPSAGASAIWRITVALPDTGDSFALMAALDDQEPVRHEIRRVSSRILLPLVWR